MAPSEGMGAWSSDPAGGTKNGAATVDNGLENSPYTYQMTQQPQLGYLPDINDNDVRTGCIMHTEVCNTSVDYHKH